MDLDDEELEATRKLHSASRDEIKVGDYVRSWNGTIGKVTRIEEGRFLYDDKELICFIASVVKHSKKLIDLIEEGDYVNGYKVLYVGNEEPCPSGKYVDIDCNKPSEETYFFESEIKSIVTKEQIKQIEFRIKE